MTPVRIRHTRDLNHDYSGATDVLTAFAIVVIIVALFMFVPSVRELGMKILEGWSYING